jgi:twitching motility protein PilT
MAEPDPDLRTLVDQLNRGAAAPENPLVQRVSEEEGGAEGPGATPGLDPVLAQAARLGASDVLLVAGAPAAFRVHGRLSPGGGAPLEAEEVRGLLSPLLTARQQQELQRSRSLDFCFQRPGVGRCRANLHFQRGSLAGSIRLLPERVPTLDSLHLPPGLRRLAEARQGLVLVTGATGSGKSSTLAALIDLINTGRRDHIVTIEDPVEYLHPNHSSIVEQIEVGLDSPDFAGALRSIVRQNPDVVLVGEMRDPETIALVLTAAETGHLVLSTLHSGSAPMAIDRIVDIFPEHQQAQIRLQVAGSLRAVVTQRLLEGVAPGMRYPALEILMVNYAVGALIREGKTHQLATQIQTGRDDGMVALDASLLDLVRAGRISREVAVAAARDPVKLQRRVREGR